MSTSSTKQKIRHSEEENKSFKLKWDVEKSMIDIKLMNIIRREK